MRGVTDVEIVHPVPADEAGPWLANLLTALLGNPYDDRAERRTASWQREWRAERSWGARADGRWVGTLATVPRVLSVPGFGGTTRDLAGEALWGVSVNATHRRQGLLTRMLTASLTAARERGDAVSLLYAAEWPIYGRFGYAPATADARYSYFPRQSGVTPTGRGRVRQVTTEELGELGPGIHEAARRTRAGHVDRPGLWWQRRLGLAGLGVPSQAHAIVREGPDGPDGLLTWKPAREVDLDGTLGIVDVVDLVTATDDAYRNLWAYLSGLDVVGEVRLVERPVDEPVRRLLADGRALRTTYAGDALWLRLLDVPAALAARGYAVPGILVLQVEDDTFGWANGRFALEASESEASCTATTDSPDLRLTHRALASAYLGGHTLRSLLLTGEVEELTPGALSRADAMLATGLAPWNATPF